TVLGDQPGQDGSVFPGNSWGLPTALGNRTGRNADQSVIGVRGKKSGCRDPLARACLPEYNRRACDDMHTPTDDGEHLAMTASTLRVVRPSDDRQGWNPPAA